MHTIQGSGSASPMVGQTVTVEGILTQDSRHKGGFGGFYLQQADSETDQDPATSEALFIYTRQAAGKPGQRLR
ncbi:MAG: endonuclease, partial [Marinobacter sp.]|nr:endonuclease [Marinobacter sp.]